jgi:hypothetical protein
LDFRIIIRSGKFSKKERDDGQVQDWLDAGRRRGR